MEELTTYRRIVAGVLLTVMVLVALSSCGPNLSQSLTDTVTAFYSQVARGNNPYGTYNAAPLWPKLPVDAPQIAKAEVKNVADAAQDGKWIVQAELEVTAGEAKVSVTEETSWVREGNAWVLTGVRLANAQMAQWPEGPGQGLLAFEHRGRVWLVDTKTGSVSQLANPETGTVDGDSPLYVDEWAPNGSGLLLYTENAAYWYRPATGNMAKVADTGNYGGVTWSNDGKYGLIDWGTDVIRTLEVFDVTAGKVIGRLAAYGALWSPDGDMIIAKPEPVTPEWPAGDGSSFSLARAMIRIVSGAPTVLTETLVPGTSTAMFRPEGYGRDGTLYYTQTELRNDTEVVTWWKWDAEAKQGTRVWSRPALEVPEGPATVRVPSQLNEPRTTRVEVSGGGRWGFFSATEGQMEAGIYLIDLTAPANWQRVFAGSSPRWAVEK